MLGLAWVLATPLFAAPDEPAHVVRAASVGRGQLLGTTPPKDQLVPPIGDAATVVTAPGIYRSANNVACYVWQSKTPAGCFWFAGSRAETHVETYVGHHSPAYYAPVGFLSRVLRPGVGQVYLMRIIGMLAIAALLASALETLRRTLVPMWAGTGFAIALSPMVLFLGATVSPSGLEVGAAIGVWVHGSVLAREADGGVDPRLVDRLGIAASLLVLARALSPLWVAVVGLVLVVLTTRAGLRALVHSRRVRIWAGVLAVCAATQLWWYAYGHPLSHFVGTPVHESGLALVRTSFGKSGDTLREMIGVFGWLDTRAPGVTYLVWLLALGAILALALAVASARFVWALLAATAATVVIPVLVEAAGARRGRLHLAGALLAAARGRGPDRRRRRRRLLRGRAPVRPPSGPRAGREPRGRPGPGIRAGDPTVRGGCAGAALDLRARAVVAPGDRAGADRRVRARHRRGAVVDRPRAGTLARSGWRPDGRPRPRRSRVGARRGHRCGGDGVSRAPGHAADPDRRRRPQRR